MTTATARCPISTSTINGDEIRNRNDDVLGSVHDIMLDRNLSRVAYIVMTSGGFLGMGNKLFAIPISALEVDTEQKERQQENLCKQSRV